MGGMRRLSALVLLAAVVLAVVAGIAWTPLAFLAVPFLLVVGYAMRQGISGDQLLESLDTDPGSGPAGLH